MEYNNCKENLFNDCQKLYLRQNYFLDNLSICSDIGKLRKTQEDSFIIDYHPLDKNIKFIALADGMGGLVNGALASNITLKNMSNWFSKAPLNILENNLLLNKEIREYIYFIDDEIREKCSAGGTTLILAILKPDNAFCLNIGDSRLYIEKNNKLNQISIDHSIVFNLFLEGKIKKKEEMMFHKQNNLILSRIGGTKRMLKMDDFIIKDEDYNKMFLFSDGVTDCLTDQQLEGIVNSTDDYLAIKIVEKALNNILMQNYLDEDYYNKVVGGKDNTTAVVYTKRRK